MWRRGRDLYSGGGGGGGGLPLSGQSTGSGRSNKWLMGDQLIRLTSEVAGQGGGGRGDYCFILSL